jgi:hypothetical protein
LKKYQVFIYYINYSDKKMLFLINYNHLCMPILGENKWNIKI